MSVVLSHSVLGQFFMQQWNTNINMKKVLFASSFLYALLIFYLVFCMKMPKSDSWISSRCVCVFKISWYHWHASFEKRIGKF